MERTGTVSIVFGLESREDKINTEVIFCGGMIKKIERTVSFPLIIL